MTHLVSVSVNIFLNTANVCWQLDGAQKDIDKDDEPDFYEEAPLPG